MHYANWDRGNNVMNGIMYLPYDDTFLIGGKMWDHVHKVKLNYEKYVVPDSVSELL